MIGETGKIDGPTIHFDIVIDVLNVVFIFMNKKIHTGAHKYRKTKLSRGTGTVVFRCVLPDCSHYILPHLLKGRKSICWRCRPEHEFVIEREHERMAKPHCSKAIVRKSKISDDLVEDILKDVGIFD